MPDFALLTPTPDDRALPNSTDGGKATQLALALATDAPRENDPMIFSPTIVRRDSVAQKREP